MLSYIVFKISSFSALPGIYFGIIGRKKIKRSARIILMLMLASFFSDMLCFFLGKQGVNNLPVIHFYSALQGLILLFFFREQFSNRKRLMNTFIVLLLIFHLSDSLWLTGLFQPNALAMTVQSFFMIVLCLFFFYKVYEEETDIFIYNNQDFLFVIGILFYFSVAFFPFLFSSELLSWASPLGKPYGLWNLHNIANIIKNIIFALALWRAQKA